VSGKLRCRQLSLTKLIRDEAAALARVEMAAAMLEACRVEINSYDEAAALCEEVCSAVYRLQLSAAEIERLTRRRLGKIARLKPIVGGGAS
jgi:hypothetical protein